MVVSVDVFTESCLSVGVMTSVEPLTMNKDDVSFGLLLCWEPLFVSVMTFELEQTYLGSEEWDILGADDVLFHCCHFLGASRWVWWV
jgi:hypothetical protein